MRALIPRHPAAILSPFCLLATCLAVACAGPGTSGSSSSGPAPGTLAVVLRRADPWCRTLGSLVGEFEVDCLWWPAAGEDPIASRGRLHGYWDDAAGMVVGEFGGDLEGGFFPSRTRTGWDALRGCYVADWRRADGDLLLPLSDGHARGAGELIFARGSAEALSIQVLTVLGREEHLIELSAPAGATGSAPQPLLRLRCRRRDLER